MFPGDKGGHFHVPIVLKFGSRNFLEPLGPVQSCNGISLPFYCMGWVINVTIWPLYPQESSVGYGRLEITCYTNLYKNLSIFSKVFLR